MRLWRPRASMPGCFTARRTSINETTVCLERCSGVSPHSTELRDSSLDFPALDTHDRRRATKPNANVVVLQHYASPSQKLKCSIRFASLVAEQAPVQASPFFLCSPSSFV